MKKEKLIENNYPLVKTNLKPGTGSTLLKKWRLLCAKHEKLLYHSTKEKNFYSIDKHGLKNKYNYFVLGGDGGWWWDERDYFDISVKVKTVLNNLFPDPECYDTGYGHISGPPLKNYFTDYRELKKIFHEIDSEYHPPKLGCGNVIVNRPIRRNEITIIE